MDFQSKQPRATTPWLKIVLVLALLIMIMPGFASATGTTDTSTTNRATQDQSRALVLLIGDPLATSSKTKPAPGKKIDFNNSGVKAYRAQLSAQRNDFKAWLRANAPKAKVTGEYDIALNAVAVQLNGEALALIAGAPQALTAQYEGLYYPTGSDPDLTIISAFHAWGRSGGAANAGTGIKVAIVDSGVDLTHPCFSDAGYPAQSQLGDKRFTNNKVIAAKVFNNKAVSRGYTPEAIDSHGTHVAGTVACNYQTPAVVDGVDIPYDVSGVAPRALLGNYNVFPGEEGNARSEDIMNALEAAYADGFDIANMSLGGGAAGVQDLLTMAVDNLDQANMVVAVASGNSGPGHYTVESPGSAARALTAGASTVPHFVGSQVLAGGSRYNAATGDFATVSANLTAPLGVVSGSLNGLDIVCAALPANSLIGKIALLSRGSCDFTVKIRNAQAAGAVAVLVVNNVAGDPIAMGTNGEPNQPTIPAYMLSRDNGIALIAFNGQSVTIGAPEYFSTGAAGQDIMAGFSSQGPTDVDFRVKPDVVAPGVNVLSSIPHTYCAAPPCWAFFQGTSMATPHLAGSAAIVKQQHPTWSAAQIRSALVNTADSGVLKSSADGVTIERDVNIIGAGQTQSAQVTLTDLGGGGTYSLAVAGSDSSAAFSVSPATITLAPGGSATVNLTLTTSKGALAGDHQATLTVSKAGGAVAHAAVYVLIK